MERFWNKVKKTNHCWNWIGSIDPEGYGRITIDGQNNLAHRLSLELILGKKLSKKLCVLHKCDNRKCVYPGHLYLGSKKDNAHDMMSRNRAALAKLKTYQIIKIRKLFNTGKFTHEDIAKKFDISRANITNIVNNKTWKGVS